jgi:hypothetical protein
VHNIFASNLHRADFDDGIDNQMLIVVNASVFLKCEVGLDEVDDVP